MFAVASCVCSVAKAREWDARPAAAVWMRTAATSLLDRAAIARGWRRRRRRRSCNRRRTLGEGIAAAAAAAAAAAGRRGRACFILPRFSCGSGSEMPSHRRVAVARASCLLLARGLCVVYVVVAAGLDWGGYVLLCVMLNDGRRGVLKPPALFGFVTCTYTLCLLMPHAPCSPYTGLDNTKCFRCCWVEGHKEEEGCRSS
jgi:hypothetical protein